MIIIGIVICIASFFVTEKFNSKEENLHNLMSVDDDYEFSEREIIILRLEKSPGFMFLFLV